ncbi:MAG: tryptophan synthase subunit alpha [Bacteroidales bacterium]
MNRIDQLLTTKSANILSIYFTAGYPNLEDTVSIIKELEKSGADLIEIGFPFSDPVADGPVIQESSEIALKNGMTLNLLFDQLKNIRQNVTIPLILMGYINPVLQFGIEKFCRIASETGIDGVILPDLPIEIYLKEYKEVFLKYGIYYIPLVPPQASDQRIQFIDRNTEGFIYLVSSSSTTGTKNATGNVLEEFMQRIRKLNLKNKQLIGFGINNRDTFNKVCRMASGGIIGTAFINALKNKSAGLTSNIQQFISSIR